MNQSGKGFHILCVQRSRYGASRHRVDRDEGIQFHIREDLPDTSEPI